MGRRPRARVLGACTGACGTPVPGVRSGYGTSPPSCELHVCEFALAKPSELQLDTQLSITAPSGSSCSDRGEVQAQAGRAGAAAPGHTALPAGGPTFFEWFDMTFGVMLAGDPVFVLDLKIDARYQDEDGVVAAHSVLEALAAFGSAHSPLVTFHEERVGESTRAKCKAEGLWSWIEPLRAERWKGVYVTCRPQD